MTLSMRNAVVNPFIVACLLPELQGPETTIGIET